jgi:hypothetical protein
MLIKNFNNMTKLKNLTLLQVTQVIFMHNLNNQLQKFNLKIGSRNKKSKILILKLYKNNKL